MAILYVVDRFNRYQEKQIVSLEKFDDILPIELSCLVNELFPDGVSRQGEAYFIGSQPFSERSINIDWSFEFYRRAKHPTKPSRWQSLFASQSLSDAIIFRESYGKQDDPIYELDVDLSSCHIADMNLLNNNNTALMYTYHADLYWQGQTMPTHLAPNNTARWEVLVPLPVTIGKQIA